MKPPTPAGGCEGSTGAMDAVPCWDNREAFFLRRKQSNTPTPRIARPIIGPATAPASHAFEPDPDEEAGVETFGAVAVCQVKLRYLLMFMTYAEKC